MQELQQEADLIETTTEQPLNGIVAQRVDITPDLMILRVVPDGWELPDFKPGQFAVLGLPPSAPRSPFSDDENGASVGAKLIRRAYSVASSSLGHEYIEFYVTLVRSGALTPRLFALKPGDAVWLEPKIVGMFTLDLVPDDKHLVLIGTGTGLAPYMSMLRSELVCGGPGRFAVLHGARHSWDLGYRAELLTLSRICSNVIYLPIVSRPGEERGTWSGAAGYVQDLWKSGAVADAWGSWPTPDDTHIFLCGNPKMTEEMLELLAEKGFREHKRRRPGTVHVERYW